MPIFAYAVQHPGRATIFDSGPSEHANDADYYSADPYNEFFCKRNMHFHLPGGEVTRWLRAWHRQESRPAPWTRC